ncbi:MAG: transcriptional regulator [Planctomycetes bacterium SCN 63-9]|nr:MAG: transcriptional regulator [Planctomycetes bacterium SCN 63-9]
MADTPRLLVINRDGPRPNAVSDRLAEAFEIVTVGSVSEALASLRDQEFSGVFVETSQIPSLRGVGVSIQAEEILDAIADGVAVVDPDLRIIWANPEFHSLLDSGLETVIGEKFYIALDHPDILGPDPCPFTSAVASRAPAGTVMKIEPNRYLRVTVTPVFDGTGRLTHMIALTRDITDETQQQQKVNAIHKAGDELADLTPDELSEMGVEERVDLLKFNIARHMKDLLGLDFIEIRLLDRGTGRLIPLLTEGMTPLAANRELYARKEGNGVTGFVAATGQSYLCPDSTNDPLFLEGAAGARSSLTVPLSFHGTVVGTLNVESGHNNAFDDRDRQFLEIYGRNIAAALNTLELLQAEKASTATASVEAISRELAIPLDDIISDATTVLDRYSGHDDGIISRLRHLLYRAREIRSLIQKVGSTIVPQPKRSVPVPAPRLAGTRLLVADADEAIRRSAHTLLGHQGASVETARDAHEAIALMRQSSYSAAFVDIRLPDLDGYETFKRLREVQPGVPIILMTGFGYDPSHSIVKARQEGLQTVLYKPFRADRLMDAVDQALRGPSPAPPKSDPAAAPPSSSPPSPPPASPDHPPTSQSPLESPLDGHVGSPKSDVPESSSEIVQHDS